MKNQRLTFIQSLIIGRLLRGAKLVVNRCYCHHDHAVTIWRDDFHPVPIQSVNGLEKRGLIETKSFSGRYETMQLKKLVVPKNEQR
jgi:hypothetical protein